MRLNLVLISLTIVGHPLLSQAPDTSQRVYPAARATSGRVDAQYDSKNDKTVLQLRPVVLDSTLSMTALVALDGRTVTAAPNGVVLTLWSTAKGHPLAADPAIELTLGTTTFDLGPAWLTPQPSAGYTEVAMKSVPLGLWLALALADSATLRVGARTFALPAETLTAIRDFASRMAQSAPGD